MHRMMIVTVALIAISIFCICSGPAAAIVVTFEEGLGKNGTAINTQYQGITFQGSTGKNPWVYLDATTGKYGVSSWPSGQSWGSGEFWINDHVSAWTTSSGANGQISFNQQNASFVQLNYASVNPFYLEAYDLSNHLIASASGPANLRYTDNNPNGPGTLRVDAPIGEHIAYVWVHDSGNAWTVDNLYTDAGGIRGPGDLEIVKFLDGNRNGILDPGESLVPNWEYLVEGPNGYSQNVYTGMDGTAWLSGLEPGAYTITEYLEHGWIPTTPVVVAVDVVHTESSVAMFGNVPEPATVTLLVISALCFLTYARQRTK